MFSDLVLAFLIDISTQIIAIVGIAYIPLIVLIVFRGGRMRGLNPDNMSEKLWDLCFDTIREKIRDRVEELIQSANLNLPPRLTISDIAAHLHQDDESLEQLLTILKNLSELGLQSSEFQHHFISQF